MNPRLRRLRRSLSLGLFIVLGVLVFAYGFEVTQIDLAETREPQRKESLTRVLRALAHPEIFTYEKEEFIVSHPIWIACPETLPAAPPADESLPYLVLDPPCGEPEQEIGIEGFNFEPRTRGPINLIPPSGVTLQLGNAVVDASGHFTATVELPNRQPVEEAQEIRVVTRRNIGPPKFTQTALDTWDKIVETVFMALLGTTFGTLLAIPVSFLAARNLMKEVSSPLSSAALSIIAWPVGILLGLQVSSLLGVAAGFLEVNNLLHVGGTILSPLFAWWMFNRATPQQDQGPVELRDRLTRYLLLILAVLFGTLTLRLASPLFFSAGNFLVTRLGSLGFLGTFVADLGEISGIILNLALILAGGAFAAGLGSRLGHQLNARMPRPSLLTLNLPLAAVAGAVLFAILGAAADWFYQYNDSLLSLWGPAAAGAVIGLLAAVRARREDTLSTGMAIYYVTRTSLNVLRSIEALIMAIVFAVWVSIGPFAGVLALSLHTVAALAKLYSEQVESIQPGPLEAIKATGATRMQMIAYSVIPQIVPPYIAFTFYRWDINVRMSTIIGFAGGGGIGFLLQQNINLLNYRAASAQMLAIAIVVAGLDYVSSSLRERVI